MPTAHAPSETASSASCGRVTPQTFTLVGAVGAGSAVMDATGASAGAGGSAGVPAGGGRRRASAFFGARRAARGGVGVRACAERGFDRLRVVFPGAWPQQVDLHFFAQPWACGVR